MMGPAVDWNLGSPNLPDLLTSLVRTGRTFDLSQETSNDMPTHPRQPPFLLTLHSRHGDTSREHGYSAANELLVMCGHHGTHMDALNHVSVHGLLRGGAVASVAQQGTGGLVEGDIASASPIMSRGVLLDLPAHRGVVALPAGSEVKLTEVIDILDKMHFHARSGDVFLFHTGWGSRWTRPDQYYPTDGQQPGPGVEVANWLIAREARAVGSDTMVFERVGPRQNAMPVHSALLYAGGIHIMENLLLDDLAQSGVGVFLFVALPLKLRGATGSPIRPIALA